MLTALSTGHDGSLCTVHAGSPTEALRRVETLALMADVGLPHAAIREQVADALRPRGLSGARADGARRVVAVAEVVRVAAGPAARELYTLRDGAPRWRRRARSAAARGATALARGAASTAAALSWRVAARVRGAAAAAAVLGVVGAARGRRAARGSPRRSRRVVAPVVRAGPRGGAPTVAERRRLAVLAAAAWPRRAGCSAGRGRASLAGVAGPVVAAALVRARRRRFRAALAARAPVVARALADALSAGHAVRGALEIAAAGVPGAGGPRARPRRRGRCSSASRPRRCSNACAAARLAGVGHDGRRHPAPARRRRGPAGAAARPRRGARGRRAPGARRDRGDRPGALHRLARARAAARRRAARRAAQPGLSPASSRSPSRPGSPASRWCCSSIALSPSAASRET